MVEHSNPSSNANVALVTARASDVAALLRELASGASIVKVHKLLYYVQGHHLAWHGRPAFPEAIEAWANGPVVAELWKAEKYDPPAEPGSLDTSVLEVAHMVASRYGHLSGRDLIKLTHNENPWRDLAESDDEATTANAVISHDALRAFFAQDHDLTPAVRERLAQLRAAGEHGSHDWVPSRPGELDDLEAKYSRS